MKTLIFKPIILCYLFKVAVVLTIVFFVSACRPITSADISGTYVRKGGGITDTLTLNTNGTFLQTIICTDGRTWSKNGNWTFDSRVVKLDVIYEAFSSEYPAIIIPPLEVSTVHLMVEKKALIANFYVPKWQKRN